MRLFQEDTETREANALQTLDDAIERYDPSHVLALMSGGNDSLASTILASKHPRFSGVVHINTGIGVQQTRRFVRETCVTNGWDLYERFPPQKQYPDIVQRFGFPAWPMHTMVYRALKEKALRRLCVDLREKKRSIMLVGGARANESRRRMGTSLAVTEDTYRIWINPLLSWDTFETKDYVAKARFPTNPVSRNLHMSGECLCGCAARPDELGLIRAFYPEAAEYIDWLATLARKVGKNDKWGTRMSNKGPVQTENQESFMPMCDDCSPVRGL